MRVERGEGLVHQQHLRVGRERAGQRHALLHAARQLVHMRMLELLEADELEIVIGDLAALRCGQVRPQLQPEHHVAERIEPRETAPIPGTSPGAAGPGLRHSLPSASTSPVIGLGQARR